jgi:SAM-dependent methyltransferase
MTHNDDSLYKEQFDLLSYSTSEYEQSVPFIERTLITQLPERKVLLDIGAGSGNFTKPLSSLFEQTKLIEPNTMYFEELLDWGKAEDQSIEGYNGDWLDYDLQGAANLAIMSHVLYFVPSAKRKAFIEKAYTSVKEGGFLVIILISATSGISHLYRGLLSPEDYAEMPSIESVLVDMHAQGYEHMHLTLFDAVIDIPNKASMDYLIDFLVIGKIAFDNEVAIKRRDSYIEAYLQTEEAYTINSNIGLLVLRKV